MKKYTKPESENTQLADLVAIQITRGEDFEPTAYQIIFKGHEYLVENEVITERLGKKVVSCDVSEAIGHVSEAKVTKTIENLVELFEKLI